MDRQASQPAKPDDLAYESELKREPESGRFSESRSWWDRTSDEVAAWFGNVDALRRRQRDVAVGDHAGQGPSATIDEDMRITDQISRRMTNDPNLDASRVAVSCRDRVVTLTGEVLTDADRRLAEHLAAAAPGALEVRNSLVVA